MMGTQWGLAGDLLGTFWGLFGDLLEMFWRPVGDGLKTCWRLVRDLLETYCRHVGVIDKYNRFFYDPLVVCLISIRFFRKNSMFPFFNGLLHI